LKNGLGSQRGNFINFSTIYHDGDYRDNAVSI
jgi:hypothetical protein